MKKLTIGRNNACDIVIHDTSDLVSRKQAILQCTFWGKMVLYDTSNNGTFVNGQKLENGKGRQVTRKDKVNFARIADLDWKDVKDPYRKEKMISVFIIAIIIILSILVSIWFILPEKKDITEPEKTEAEVEKGETVTSVQPKVVEERTKQQPIKKHKTRNSNKKGKSITPNDMKNKEMNDKTPIMY